MSCLSTSFSCTGLTEALGKATSYVLAAANTAMLLCMLNICSLPMLAKQCAISMICGVAPVRCCMSAKCDGLRLQHRHFFLNVSSQVAITYQHCSESFPLAAG